MIAEPHDIANALKANEVALVLACRSCGKLHPVREVPRDAAGTAVSHFLFTCIGCGKTEIRAREDLTEKVPQPSSRRKLRPSRSP